MSWIVVCDNFQNLYLSPLNTPSRLLPRRVSLASVTRQPSESHWRLTVGANGRRVTSDTDSQPDGLCDGLSGQLVWRGLNRWMQSWNCRLQELRTVSAMPLRLCNCYKLLSQLLLFLASLAHMWSKLTYIQHFAMLLNVTRISLAVTEKLHIAAHHFTHKNTKSWPMIQYKIPMHILNSLCIKLSWPWMTLTKMQYSMKICEKKHA